MSWSMLAMMLCSMTSTAASLNVDVRSLQPKACRQSEFLCPEGYCISGSWVCDGIVDCSQGEDEDVNNCVRTKAAESSSETTTTSTTTTTTNRAVTSDGTPAIRTNAGPSELLTTGQTLSSTDTTMTTTTTSEMLMHSELLSSNDTSTASTTSTVPNELPIPGESLSSTDTSSTTSTTSTGTSTTTNATPSELLTQPSAANITAATTTRSSDSFAPGELHSSTDTSSTTSTTSTETSTTTNTTPSELLTLPSAANITAATTTTSSDSFAPGELHSSTDTSTNSTTSTTRTELLTPSELLSSSRTSTTSTETSTTTNTTPSELLTLPSAANMTATTTTSSDSFTFAPDTSTISETSTTTRTELLTSSELLSSTDITMTTKTSTTISELLTSRQLDLPSSGVRDLPPSPTPVDTSTTAEPETISTTARERCYQPPFNCTHSGPGGRILVIPGDWVCDGENDCGDQDASDEANCSSDCSLLPSGLTRYCSDGSCISAALICNGRRDCVNGSDEAACYCTESKTTVRCLSSNVQQCINVTSWCDGQPDCTDGSDELFCASVTCPENSLRCLVTNRCLPAADICDGVVDCPDYSDERNCPCSDFYGYQCGMGLCVHTGSWCDGVSDCPDGSDEPSGCSQLCAPNLYQCANGNCVTQKEVCNGLNDCSDFSDETNCQCEDFEFRCYQSGSCVDIVHWCNGRQDCPDGSDEPVTCNHMLTAGCPANWYMCDSRCLAPIYICDGTFNCVDHSDEKECDDPKLTPVYFDTSLETLAINYQGIPGYSVCSEGWSSVLSDLVCTHIGCDSSSKWLSVPSYQKSAKFLVVQHTSKLSFKPGVCLSRQAVQVQCVCNQCGTSATPTMPWPWHAAIFGAFGFVCSAAVINQEWLLTAAHCVASHAESNHLIISAVDLHVHVGSTDMWSNYGAVFGVDQIVVHPAYNRTDRSHDLALLHLGTSLTFSSEVRPVCLKRSPDATSRCFAIGFAYTPLSGFAPFHQLADGEVQILSYEQCMNESKFAFTGLDRVTTVCAKLLPQDDDICFGDAANLLVCRNNEHEGWTLTGLTSWTMTNCLSAVYANVPNTVVWIEQTVA